MCTLSTASADKASLCIRRYVNAGFFPLCFAFHYDSKLRRIHEILFFLYCVGEWYQLHKNDYVKDVTMASHKATDINGSKQLSLWRKN